MRILHVINVRWYNATAWYAFRLLKAAIKAGEAAAVAGLPDSPIINMSKNDGIKTFEANFNSNNIFTLFKTLNSFKGFIKDFQPDAIVCHRGEFFFLLALYKFFFRPNWKLVRVRGDRRPPTSDIISRFTHNVCCDKIVTPNKFMKENYMRRLKTNSEKISVIYGGVDTAFFKKNDEARSEIRKEFGFADNDFVVSVTGRFDEVKGHKIFLEACGILYRSGMKNLKIFLIGFPENISNEMIMAMAKDNAVEHITFITGKRTDINHLLNACDLGVISSIGSEAICRVAMEFMATGVPVVASDVGVLPEMTPPENSYPMFDPESLARRIENHIDYIKIYDEKDFYEDFKKAISA